MEIQTRNIAKLFGVLVMGGSALANSSITSNSITEAPTQSESALHALEQGAPECDTPRCNCWLG